MGLHNPYCFFAISDSHRIITNLDDYQANFPEHWLWPKLNRNTYMKYLLLLCFILVPAAGEAQEQTAKLLIETARILVQKGDYDNAVLLLDRAKKQEPDNIELLRDLSFANYLKRDFAKAIEIGKELTEKPNADQQSFQVLGMSYKAIASYKDCGKLYRAALRKFPNSGVIYNDYAELFAIENDLEEAIVLWEKGIELDPGYSSNYYNATMYYVQKNNWLRAAIYGELFVNLESYSTRTDEIKSHLFEVYKTLFTPPSILVLQQVKAGSVFENSMLTILAKLVGENKHESGIDYFIRIRTHFIAEWLQGKRQTYPCRLFDHHQYLLSQGLFEAYHYWLFSKTTGGEEAFRVWGKNHPKESEAFTRFQQSRVFKIPPGEYYFTR